MSILPTLLWVNEWMHVFAAFPDYVPVMQQFACSLWDAVPVYSTVPIYREFCSPLKKSLQWFTVEKLNESKSLQLPFFLFFFFKFQAEFALCYTCLPIYFLFTWTFVYHTDRDRINRVFLFFLLLGLRTVCKHVWLLRVLKVDIFYCVVFGVFMIWISPAHIVWNWVSQQDLKVRILKELLRC